LTQKKKRDKTKGLPGVEAKTSITTATLPGFRPLPGYYKLPASGLAAFGIGHLGWRERNPRRLASNEPPDPGPMPAFLVRPPPPRAPSAVARLSAFGSADDSLDGLEDFNARGMSAPRRADA
jgi:hypothetical protein